MSFVSVDETGVRFRKKFSSIYLCISFIVTVAAAAVECQDLDTMYKVHKQAKCIKIANLYHDQCRIEVYIVLNRAIVRRVN